jgi:hypothetical protein
MADPKKILPGGDLGAPADEARKDSAEYKFYVVKGKGGALKKFLGPVAKYQDIKDNLGIEEFDGSKHAAAVRSGGIAVPRIRLTIQDEKDTASISVFCALDKLATALTNLPKDKCYGKTILAADLSRKRVLI